MQWGQWLGVKNEWLCIAGQWLMEFLRIFINSFLCKERDRMRLGTIAIIEIKAVIERFFAKNLCNSEESSNFAADFEKRVQTDEALVLFCET